MKGIVTRCCVQDAISQDPRFAQLVDQGKKAKQQLAQVTSSWAVQPQPASLGCGTKPPGDL